MVGLRHLGTFRLFNLVFGIELTCLQAGRGSVHAYRGLQGAGQRHQRVRRVGVLITIDTPARRRWTRLDYEDEEVLRV